MQHKETRFVSTEKKRKVFQEFRLKLIQSESLKNLETTKNQSDGFDVR